MSFTLNTANCETGTEFCIAIGRSGTAYFVNAIEVTHEVYMAAIATHQTMQLDNILLELTAAQEPT